MSIEIRQLGPAEAAVFRDIRLEALRVSADFFGSAHEDEVGRDAAGWAAALAASPVWVAFDGAAAVGMAIFTRHAGAKKRHKGTLGGMYVAPSARGHGLAERLINAILEHASAVGVEQVLLTCMDGNGPAARLYERLGFVRYGAEPGSLKVGDVYFDDLMMVKRL